MRIAHLSDLHIDSPDALKPGMFFDGILPNRRVLGAANYLLRRRSVHQVDVLRAAIRQFCEIGVDHCVVTGDVSNLAIPREFSFVRSLLDEIGGPDRLSIVPGNHDWYTPDAVRDHRFESFFGDLIWGARDTGGKYPAHKDLDGVRLILARTAWTPPAGMAWGKMGDEQIQAIKKLAMDGTEAGLYVVLAQHHHLFRRRRFLDRFTGRFIDAETEKAMIAGAPIGLVIHGHDHGHHDYTIPSGHESGVARVICGGSATYLDEDRGRFGRIAIYDVRDNELLVEKWKYRPDQGRFVQSLEE